MPSTPSSLESIRFDEQDLDLFQVDDPRPRADALKHSILPRLGSVVQHALETVRVVYNVEPLNDSIVSKFPNFRTRRTRELVLRYDSAFYGLGGRRTKDKWVGVSRRDERPAQVIPYRLGVSISCDSLAVYLENDWLSGLDDRSWQKLLSLLARHDRSIEALCRHGNIEVILQSTGRSSLRPLREIIQAMRHSHENGILFRRVFEPDSVEAADLPFTFVQLFPLYHSYLQLAKNEDPLLPEMIDRLDTWLTSKEESEGQQRSKTMRGTIELGRTELAVRAKQVAVHRARTLPGLRWRVFMRDGWRCVACGGTSADGAILHLDHIVPRSLGGSDVIDNLQTLCWECNVGKSNKDCTDLRRHGASPQLA